MHTSFPYRGFMLDSARHFIPIEAVLKIIDAAARVGMNRFHWHLTDDQGWRVEIRHYPKLTEIGSVRGRSCFWGEDEYENNCGFYTQQDIRCAVAFARERGIEIVPEIEIPGHASAMLAAYPEFGCRMSRGKEIIDKPYTYHVLTYAGVFPNLICAGREDAVTFLENILTEICELFPGPEVHIGGDEAVKLHWRRCPDCQRRMRENGLKTENELQRWLVMRIGAFLQAKGKRTIVWNESLAGGMLPHHFIVQHWNFNDAETRQFMQEGGQVICSDADSFYISRPYFSLDARTVFEAPATPKYAEGCEESLLGYECPLWGERITNPARAEYLLFPRLAIVAMKAAGKEAGSWAECVQKLRGMRDELSDLSLRWGEEEMWEMSDQAREKAKKEEERRRALPGMPRVFDICDRILRQEALEKLLGQIDMPAEFARQVADLSLSELTEFSGCLLPDGRNGADKLSEHLLKALDERDRGDWRDKSEDIWLDTMKCFARFVKEHYRQNGYYGFDRGFWTTRQIGAKLFRIGELEYEPVEEGGEKSVHLHVPSDAELTPEKLNDSVRRARAFLQRYCPAWQEAPMTLTTWLLSEEIRPLLGKSSRIAAMRRAFDITPTQEDCLQAVLEWVYDLPVQKRTEESIPALCENTSLQKALKAALLAGQRPHEGHGVLVREFE